MKKRTAVLLAIIVLVVALVCWAQNSLGTAGGSNYQVQYNYNTGLGGISNGTAGQILISGGSSAAPAFGLNEALPVAVPSTATSAGAAGQWAYDATHIYVCVATNTWVRATLATF